MRIELVLKNYRCFPENSPARIVIEDGKWTSLLGVNNAGKSALLRFFYEFRPFWSRLSEPVFWPDFVNAGRPNLGFGNSVRDPQEVFHNKNGRPLSIEFRALALDGDPAGVSNMNPSSVTFEFHRDAPIAPRLTKLVLHDGALYPLGSGTQLVNSHFLARASDEVDLLAYTTAAARLSKAFYVGAFRNVLNTGAKADYFDISVGNAFVKRWQEMQTGDIEEEKIACNQVIQIIEELFGYDRLEIQAAKSGDTLNVVIDRRSYKLHELGAGIAQFILVLANAAAKKPAYLLIDEPELNLHPSLQVEFLSAVAKFAQHGLLFATHSVGLARATADQLYAVRRKSQGVSELVRWEASGHLTELLGALSYSGYQAVGFEKVLLVEGPTEVRTLQQFLRMLRKDHKILLLPLSGSSLINATSQHEVEEIKRITTDIHALVDSERDSASQPLSPDREAFRTTCEAAGIRCHVLERRATDNYLTEAAIRRVKGEKYSQLGHYENLRKSSLGWSKHENWRIASEMSWDDIKDTDLGRFLASL